jgi:ligand-binding SRPBCC domain-containing protein
MKLNFSTKVPQTLNVVRNGFTSTLFLKLNPPFPPVKLEQFDGCRQGDRVRLELNFIFFRQIWESLITEDGETPQEWYFIDEGVKLPFFLKTWKHRHRVLYVDGNTSEIVDEIEYSSGNRLLTLLLYPALYLQFLYRKPIYRKFFN